MKFKIGNIVRYDEGCTALFKITSILKNHGKIGNHRYYGIQCMGGSIGAYGCDLKKASYEDLKEWNCTNV